MIQSSKSLGNILDQAGSYSKCRPAPCLPGQTSVLVSTSHLCCFRCTRCSRHAAGRLAVVDGVRRHSATGDRSLERVAAVRCLQFDEQVGARPPEARLSRRRGAVRRGGWVSGRRGGGVSRRQGRRRRWGPCRVTRDC